MKPSEDENWKKIPGFLSNEEADSLYDHVLALPHQAPIVVEVGSLRGKSTYALCMAAKERGGAVYAVDTFMGSPRESAYHGTNFHDDFLANMAPILDEYAKPLYVLWMSSGGALMYFANNCLRPNMVFVDGSHVYEDVLFDLTHWWNRLIKGGYLAVHDTGGAGDVQDAYDEFLKRAGVATLVRLGSISWVGKPYDGRRILEKLEECP